MEDRKGLSLIELILAFFIIAFLIAIFMPAIGKDPKIANRVICGANLKTLGAAMTIYANDYDDNLPQLPGSGPWSKRLGFDYDLQKPDFSKGGAEGRVSRTISASW
jgi:Tfp pilus assembly protein PilE